MENLESEYKALLESGTLLEIFPDFKGVWELDKNKFISQHNKNQEILDDIDIDDDDYYDEYNF